MRNISLFLLIAILAFNTSCSKELSVQEQFDQDVAEIEAYLKAQNLTAEKTPEGIYYIINEAGSTEKPVITSLVTVKYAGKFLDQVQFDASESAQFFLYQVIQGWQIGMPKFGKGGIGKLLIPSKFAYGDTEIQGRKNAVLVFDIELKDFK